MKAHYFFQTRKLVGKFFLIVSLGLAFFVFFSKNADAATYYIPDNFSTLQAAADAANPGDIFYVRNGTYNQKVNITKSGSAGSYITFASETPKGATINGGSPVPATSNGGLVSAWNGIFTVSGASYIKISGFRIINSGYVGVRINGGGTSSNIIIENNYVNNTWSSALYAEDAGPNIVFDGNEVTGSHVKPMPGENEIVDMVRVDGYEIKYNYIHDNVSAESIDVKLGAKNGLIHHNNIKPDASAGIYLDAWDGQEDNNRVYDNIIHDGPAGARGIAMAVECGGGMHGAYIYNNIIYNMGAYGIVVALYSSCDPLSCCIGGPMDNIQVVNNTVYNNDNISHWGGGISNDNTRSDATNIVFRNNIVSQNSNQIRDLKGTVVIENNLIDGSTLVSGSGAVTGSPQFVSAGSDFHIQNTSPAKGAGLFSALQSAVDYGGMSWNNPPSIGAYENGGVVPSGTASPTPLPSSSSTPLPSSSSTPLPSSSPSASSSPTPVPTPTGTPLPTGAPIPSMSAAPSAYVAPWDYGTFSDPVTFGSIESLVEGATGWILGFAASLILLMIIIGGLIYTTSAGDEQRMAWAKKIVIAALVGFVVIILSATIVYELKKIL